MTTNTIQYHTYTINKIIYTRTILTISSMKPIQLFNQLLSKPSYIQHSTLLNKALTLQSPRHVHTSLPSDFSHSHDSRRIYSAYVIHKGKAALDIKMTPPQLGLSENSQYYTVKRTGSLVFNIAAIINEKKYDWANKLTFSMNIHECGELISYYINQHDTINNDIKFIHDPYMNTDRQGELMKTLSVRRNSSTNNKSSYFVNIHQQSQSNDTVKLSVPVSDGEMCVIVTLLQQLLPKLLCMDITPETHQSNTQSAT